MHKLKSIEIEGFRGQIKAIRLQLHENANFLIGRNGTGKTTLINLINAGLTLDIRALRDTTFNVMTFKFKPAGGRKVPSVSIIRRYDENSLDLIYEVKDSATTKTDEYPILRPVRRKVITGPDGVRRIVVQPPAVSRRPLRERLEDIYKTTWLSLQRHSSADEVDVDEFDILEDDDSTDVDKKLDQVLSELVKYFSRLDRLVADETQSFQKSWFLSFLASDRQFRPSETYKLDLTLEKTTLESIFEKFGLTSEHYRDQLDKHFSLAEKSRRSTKSNQVGKIKDWLILYDAMKLHLLVEQWKSMQDAHKKTYLPKSQFIDVASSMLFRKKIDVDRSNQVLVLSDEGNAIPTHSLSSGEKQLLIFLSETLLQEQSPYIFMADEPELSLHVEWQEELVPSLLRINPQAQVLFATHSPDIVNVYQNNVFQMEELID